MKFGILYNTAGEVHFQSFKFESIGFFESRPHGTKSQTFSTKHRAGGRMSVF
jgi:hypothetical protein